MHARTHIYTHTHTHTHTHCSAKLISVLFLFFFFFSFFLLFICHSIECYFACGPYNVSLSLTVDLVTVTALSVLSVALWHFTPTRPSRFTGRWNDPVSWLILLNALCWRDIFSVALSSHRVTNGKIFCLLTVFLVFAVMHVLLVPVWHCRELRLASGTAPSLAFRY